MRPLTIRPVVNGWVVSVGCQDAVFTNIEHMLGELRRYILNPDLIEKEYLDNSVNKGIGRPEVAQNVYHTAVPPVGNAYDPVR